MESKSEMRDVIKVY